MKLSKHQITGLKVNESRVQFLFSEFAEGKIPTEEFKETLKAHAIFILCLIGAETEKEFFLEHIEDTFKEFESNTKYWYLLSPTSSGSLINSFRVSDIRESYETEE